MGKRQHREATRLSLVGEEPEDSPARAVFEAMLDGWRSQRLARNLSFSTVEAGARVVRRFSEVVGSYPWEWSPGDLDTFMADLRRREGLARSTVRSYGLIIGWFCAFVCDPAYGFAEVCLERFGTLPVQICTRENLPRHSTDGEARPSRRPLTKTECQRLFDAADERAASVRHKGAKGFVPAFRDATMLKVAYAFGLRRHELVMLERVDFGPNPHAPEFGNYGVCHVRHGKAANGSPPRRRGVLTVMSWSAEVMAEWVEEVLSCWRPDSSVSRRGRGPSSTDGDSRRRAPRPHR